MCHWRDHSIGASIRRVTPMPRGSRPCIASRTPRATSQGRCERLSLTFLKKCYRARGRDVGLSSRRNEVRGRQGAEFIASEGQGPKRPNKDEPIGMQFLVINASSDLRLASYPKPESGLHDVQDPRVSDRSTSRNRAGPCCPRLDQDQRQFPVGPRSELRFDPQSSCGYGGGHRRLRRGRRVVRRHRKRPPRVRQRPLSVSKAPSRTAGPVLTTSAQGRIVLYRPQFTDWVDFKAVDALVAAEYQGSRLRRSPVLRSHRSRGTFVVRRGQRARWSSTDVTVTQLNFSGLGRDDSYELAIETGKLLPTGPSPFPRSRIAASLAEQQRMTDVTGLKADPPPIFISTRPAILLQTDGDADLCSREGPGRPFLPREHQLGPVPHRRRRRASTCATTPTG